MSGWSGGRIGFALLSSAIQPVTATSRRAALARTRKAPRIPRTGKCPQLRPRPQTVARCGAEVEKQENANQVTHRAAHELRDGGARRCAFASTIVPQASTSARVEWSSGYSRHHKQRGRAARRLARRCARRWHACAHRWPGVRKEYDRTALRRRRSSLGRIRGDGRARERRSC